MQITFKKQDNASVFIYKDNILIAIYAKVIQGYSPSDRDKERDLRQDLKGRIPDGIVDEIVQKAINISWSYPLVILGYKDIKG